MCYGENNAGHAVSYFNSQLKGLWDISEECADQHLDPDARLKPDARQHRYSFALSEFYYGKHRQGSSASLDDMMFHAVFSSPKLRFICNHEALFRIEVEEGHFNLDYSRASESSTADRARNRDIPSGTSFEFRIPFRTTGIKGSASLIGNGSHAFTLLVLEYRRAKLMTISRETDQPSSQALESYLQTYLAFLQSAGHHVLFSLPNFSDLEEELQIDYSEVVDSPLHLQEVHGVVIADINRYLSTLWLKAAMLASGPEGQVLDRPGISLAEYRSTWISQRADIHFHLTFGAPEVVALCNDEVIVHYVIDEAYFYKSDNFDGEALRTYQNWRVAVVFDLHHEKPDEEGGNVTRCKLNMAKPRLLPQFSSFEGVEEEDQIAVRCRFRAAEFLSGEYLSVLEGGGFHVIYYHDLRWPKPGDETENVEDFVSPNEASWSATDVIEDATGKITKTAIWRNITQASDMCGFDQITALSETAINHNFHSLSATQPLLQRWGYETCFSVNFKPPTVRLRSDGRALVSFHLKDGFVRALPYMRRYTFRPRCDHCGSCVHNSTCRDVSKRNSVLRLGVRRHATDEVEGCLAGLDAPPKW
ncbi:uncharacterized protein PHACADRAFT_145658 [Phanerochaete carnosa HHB-10118-sp]|uniref:Uncharacterized protein n=1 Tax=Phanerochaete carnosa (strain HHB-10118-sp) TaxID=650164 RepID=K5WUC9_PHACS|nr:uncharacterized protein PHACADRAFT_145658 [Phanerochaete carnosa HHB-10118-sp]EKM54057.1 hypothetical protein PHACADRAFT_145658 [Phanerochaete carnosa HHB-10118-sp]